MDTHYSSLSSAVQDFHRARRAAEMERIVGGLTGRPVGLLSYEDVRRKLHAQELAKRQLRDVPLDAIIGSVGRYTDFSRTFLPWQDSDQERWARVQIANEQMEGLPPVELYQIGSAYFVRDGHHRISVARQAEATHIEAYVTEVQTRVPITPDVTVEALVLKNEYVGFLEQTNIDQILPDADFSVTVAGQYQALQEHISVHRYFMGIERERDISYEDAAKNWYETVYLPVVNVIREVGLLKHFPDRTETDLYLWVMDHREELQKTVGWAIDIKKAAADLAQDAENRATPGIAGLGNRVLGALAPNELDAGPPPGKWRETLRDQTILFRDILVPVADTIKGCYALEQALVVAHKETASRLHGLHITSKVTLRKRKHVPALQTAFEARCQEAGIEGQLVIETGNVTQTICDRARWVDLVVLTLAHPPQDQPLSRLSSGFSALVRRCPRPILAVPEKVSPLTRALLAYDGSPKSREALFVSAYIAGCWGLDLTVVTVTDADNSQLPALEEARSYLTSHGITATFLAQYGAAGAAIRRTSAVYESDLIIMGGYGFSPVVEMVLGSTVDQVLRESCCPVLICR